MTEEKALVPVKTYNKFCKVCSKDFQSTARGTRYCSDKCSAAAQKRNKGRSSRRRKYARNKDDLRAQSRSRAEARNMSLTLMVTGHCQRCNKVHPLNKLETHHINGDPHHNPADCSNFALLCKPCHAKTDGEWRSARDHGDQTIRDPRRFNPNTGISLPEKYFTWDDLRW